MSSLHAPLQQSNLKRELVAIWGYAQRNYFLTRRYFLWEVVWLVYSTMNALTIGFIGVSVGSTAEETARATTFLLIGTLIWSYLSMIFDILSETVSWERWEGTIEYTFMSPASRASQLIGMGLFAVAYGIVRMIIMLGAISLFFDMSLGNANYLGALAILVICSISLVGFGMIAAIMPLISPEKGQQVTYIFSAVLLLISGIYYSIDVLPGWMQPLAKVSPIYYTLNGMRAMLLDGASLASQWGNIWPLLIMGLVFPPLGLYLFGRGEHYAKVTGRLKRTG
ncbi:MAG: ABC transporter permease [Thermomicrobiales bacterium]|nr:ABC transporter permease [Thermomicrobiales bacterium]MCO5223010.1 ABC transporter permease [Thermomicrobiales bacterium]